MDLVRRIVRGYFYLGRDESLIVPRAVVELDDRVSLQMKVINELNTAVFSLEKRIAELEPRKLVGNECQHRWFGSYPNRFCQDCGTMEFSP